MQQVKLNLSRQFKCQTQTRAKFQLLTWACRSLVLKTFKKICKTKYLEDNRLNDRKLAALILELLKRSNNSNYRKMNRPSRKLREEHLKKSKTLMEKSNQLKRKALDLVA